MMRLTREKQLIEEVDKMLNIQMDVDEHNPLATSLRTFKPSIVEKFLDS